MSRQPRESRSQRFARSINTPPSSALSDPLSGSEEEIRAVLDHIEEACAQLADLAREGRRAFLEEPLLQYAAKAMLIDLGTFANRLPAELRQQLPEVGYSDMYKLRNVLAHPRVDVTLDMMQIWHAVTVNVPTSVATQRRLLAQRFPSLLD